MRWDELNEMRHFKHIVSLSEQFLWLFLWSSLLLLNQQGLHWTDPGSVQCVSPPLKYRVSPGKQSGLLSPDPCRWFISAWWTALSAPWQPLRSLWNSFQHLWHGSLAWESYTAQWLHCCALKSWFWLLQNKKLSTGTRGKFASLLNSTCPFWVCFISYPT